MHTLERLILETAAAWEQEGVAHGEIRPIIGAVDETFLQRMMLVFMDLASDYVLRGEVAADRNFDTRYGGVTGRLTTFGTEVLYLVSDRAKALGKLAHTGLGASVEACEALVKHWQDVRRAWRQPLSNLSRILHPWRLVDPIRIQEDTASVTLRGRPGRGRSTSPCGPSWAKLWVH
jgi:hypothetical protein